ncbi:Arginase [Hondaea fermentalgiana]|uniref:Arginase n=1 Tax=Hondaea fermentalgiana TaxID=2315210 RepID=A0A2R5GDU1_9STRA|nr:Arginase [Hondaea fermentalgiana]|eukprot:GBG29097.1 Arginase [Hondaea fermentalgiana]
MGRTLTPVAAASRARTRVKPAVGAAAAARRRWRVSGAVTDRTALRKTPTANKREQASTQPITGEPPRRWRSTEASAQHAKHGFNPEQMGMGGAVVHGNYDHLGEEVEVPPFLRVPKTASIIGAPMSWGQPRAGTDQGSQILRACGLEDNLLALEWRIDDKGDLEFDEPTRNDPAIDPTKVQGLAKNCFTVGKGLKKIHDRVYEAAKEKEFALILGGDHSLSAGSVSAILRARPDTGIIWVDAHGDLNTPETSPSGNMHGMPLGLMLGLIDPTLLPGFEWFKDVPKLNPEQIVFVGLRDLDAGERKIIRDHKITAFSMHHVDRFGIGNVMDMAIESLRKPDGSMRPLHLSYDIDAVDPEVAPSTGTVVRGGLNFREAHYVAEAVGNTGMLGSMDLVEVNPKLAPGPESEMTAALGMALISSAMGARII